MGTHRLYLDPTPEQLRRRYTASRIVPCTCALARDHLVGHLLCFEQADVRIKRGRAA